MESSIWSSPVSTVRHGQADIPAIDAIPVLQCAAIPTWRKLQLHNDIRIHIVDPEKRMNTWLLPVDTGAAPDVQQLPDTSAEPYIQDVPEQEVVGVAIDNLDLAYDIAHTQQPHMVFNNLQDMFAQEDEERGLSPIAPKRTMVDINTALACDDDTPSLNDLDDNNSQLHEVPAPELTIHSRRRRPIHPSDKPEYVYF